MKKSREHRVGIMGGSFNPPHLGHLTMAEWVRDRLGLTKVVFIPTGRIDYKDDSHMVSAEDRLAMVRLAIKGNPYFEVNDIEVRNGNFTYTYRTLKSLHDLEPKCQFCFIVGADSLDYMEKWRHPEELFRLAEVVVVSRAGFSEACIQEKCNALRLAFGAQITQVPMPWIAISSTELRKQISEGKSVRYLLPNLVEQYIAEHELYHKNRMTFETRR